MDVKNEIAKTLSGTLRRHSKKNDIPQQDLRISITMDSEGSFRFDLLHKTEKLYDIDLAETLGLNRVMNMVIDPLGKQGLVRDFLTKVFVSVMGRMQCQSSDINIKMVGIGAINYLLFINNSFKQELEIDEFLAA